MSRCVACDIPMFASEIPTWNPHTNQEEDMCSVCRHLANNSSVEKEYVCGTYPVEGVTLPLATKEY